MKSEIIFFLTFEGDATAYWQPLEYATGGYHTISEIKYSGTEDVTVNRLFHKQPSSETHATWNSSSHHPECSLKKYLIYNCQPQSTKLWYRMYFTNIKLQGMQIDHTTLHSRWEQSSDSLCSLDHLDQDQCTGSQTSSVRNKHKQRVSFFQ